jgi:hypothetical protein
MQSLIIKTLLATVAVGLPTHRIYRLNGHSCVVHNPAQARSGSAITYPVLTFLKSEREYAIPASLSG